MPTSKDLCPHCGFVHERPFSDEILALYHKIRAAHDESERSQLLFSLVTEYADEFDSTNEDCADNVHELVDEFVAVRIEQHQVAMQLGRMLLRHIQQYVRAENERTKQKRKVSPKTN